MRMDELAAPAIDGRARRARHDPPAVAVAPLRRVAARTSGPWCISRQLWWGHQIPVWYRGDEVYAGTEPPRGRRAGSATPTCSTRGSAPALWPFATLGWPEQTPDLRAFYPTDVLSTARDILFLWVARMVMMGLEFTGEIPFADVYVHSVIQAPDGRRMSKSLGTGIDPIDEIERHGADAVRFGLLAMSSTQDVKYSSEKVQQGQRLANKLFNASRYVLLNVPRTSSAEPRPQTRLRPLDPVAPAGGEGGVRRQRRALRLLQGRARPLRLRLRRAVRLVPRVHEGPRVRRGPLGDDAPRPARDARARAPDDPVRHRGAVGPRARHRGAARDGADHARPTRPCATRRPRPRWPP